MALEENNGMGTTMLFQPANGGSNGGFGFGNDGGWWILLLFLLLGNGGWGMGGGFGGDGLYPWMNNSQNINSGFRDQMLNTSIASIGDKITSGFGDVQTALCGGFAGVNAGIANAAAQTEIAANGRQMANMQQMFGLQSQLAQCCCDNRAATADLKYTVATEACADRSAVSDALRDVLAANTASTQRILDQLCQDKIDAKNEEIANLRQQLNMASLAASQNAQTATIQAGQRALANEVEQYVLPTPRPAYVVANPNCCQPNYGCGCGAA